MNSINIVGNLVEDAQVKAFNAKDRSGAEYEKKFCAFKIADNLSGTTEHTNFFDCVYFTNGADKFAPYLKKGTQVTLINSTLKVKTSQKGDKWYTNVTVNVRDISLPPKPKASQESQSAAGDLIDDEIPF